MKLPVFRIPLAYFGAAMCALAGFLLGAASIGNVVNFKKLSFISISSVIATCLAIAIGACALALACRRAWARPILVYLLLAMAVLLIATLAHDLWRIAVKEGRVLFNLVAGPIILSAVGLLMAFLLNRPLVDELTSPSEEPIQPQQQRTCSHLNRR